MRMIRQILLTALLVISCSKVYSQIDSLSIYPNPFTTTSKIYFYLSQSDTTSLIVYNAWGDTVEAPFNDTLLSVGSYTFIFGNDSLKNGKYFIRLTSGSTIRMQVLVKISPTSSIIDKPSSSNQVLIFPNPANGNVSIRINNTLQRGFRLNISDNLGRQVFTETYFSSNIEIDLSRFVNGIYTISIPSLNYNYKLILIK